MDTGVRQGDEVTPNYDPMLAKLIVWAPNRTEALEKMRRALDEFVVLGCTTNIRFLRELCDQQEVIDGTTDTTTIDRIWPNGWTPSITEQQKQSALVVAATAESLGLGKTKLQVSAEQNGPVSPFQIISRRFP